MRLTEEEQAALKASLHEIIDQLDITHCNIEAVGRHEHQWVGQLKPTEKAMRDTGVRILWIVGNVTPDPEVGIYPVGSVSADDFPYEFEEGDDG